MGAPKFKTWFFNDRKKMETCEDKKGRVTIDSAFNGFLPHLNWAALIT
jgi:hypothetical protein